VSNYDRAGTDSRKQAVSIRMNRSDVRNIKRLAERLGARDSDVIRFAIKLMLSRLSPLQDPSVRGRGLVPVFLESGPELIRHFELDAARLESIINEDVAADESVDPDDVQLIAMNGLQHSYLKLRVAGFRRAKGGEPPRTSDKDASGAPNGGEASTNGHAVFDGDPEQSLRQYLYEKYLYSRAPDESRPLSARLR
jgi:hypothetical protein